MKRAKILSLLIAVVMLCAVVLVACQVTEFTVTYKSGTTVIGSEKVKKGEHATANVAGYKLNGQLRTEDGEVFDYLVEPINGDITLIGEFVEISSSNKDGEVSWVNDTKNYTYRVGPASLPQAWNVHTYSENTSTYILNLTSDSLYTLDYNEDYTTYKIIPSMASGDPVDVTKQYAGKYGIPADAESAYAYAIPLKTWLKFDDGTAINANTFVRSVRNLLNPEAANLRANEMWKNDLKIYGAEKYAKSGKTTYEDVTGGEGVGSGIYVGFDSSRTDCGISKEIADTLYFSFADSFVGTWVNDEYGSRYPAQLNEWGLVGLFLALFEPEGVTEEGMDALEGKTLTQIVADADLRATLQALFDWWCTVAEEEFGFFTLATSWDEYSFDQVGFFAANDNTLVIALSSPMEDNFFLRYNLCTSYFLVNNALYESKIDTSSGLYTNSYGTSVDTYSGFGPYKLVSFVADNKFRMERNEYWHGYYEKALEGSYQATAVEYIVVKETATRLEMFLKGQLDSYGLTAADMADYVSSKYTYYQDSESTWFFATNPNVAKLKLSQETATPVTTGNTVVKTPLAIYKFRQALSWAMDRQTVIQSIMPTAGIAKACLSAAIISDPDAGTYYRSTIEAQDAILKYWGLSDAWGEGKEYETRLEAIDSITGYDPAGAKTLYTEAYEEARALGYITDEMHNSGKWEMQICLGTQEWDDFYNRIFDTLKTVILQGVVGTPWEGHLELIQSGNLGPAYADELRAGNVDLLPLVGWGGDEFNPFAMMQCFVDDGLSYDTLTDKTKIMMDVEIKGQTLRASLYDWVNDCLMGTEITATVVNAAGEATSETVKINAGTSADMAVRLAILAQAEVTVLDIGNMIPIMTDASASLRCMRITYKTEDYVLGIGRGGLKYNTFSYSDEEFAAFVSAQGGTLNYKVSE